MTAQRIVAIGLLVPAIVVGLAAHDASVPRRSSGPSAVPAAPLDPSMLQFRSGGQLLGFTAGRAYAAGPGSALIEEFVGAHPVQPVASGSGQARETGGAPPLQAVTYAQLWDGITVTYEAAPAGFAQTTYRIDPHADPDRIRIRYNTDVALDADGSLRVQHPTARGYFSLSAPRAWQDVDGRRIPVRVAFTPPDARVVGFTVGAYDPAQPLLIDPTYAWHTFQGSAGNDYGYGIAVDGDGNVYVAGLSSATWGTPLHAHSGGVDIVVVKFDAAGSLLWHTFYGPSHADRGAGIAVDGSGNVYVAGASSASWGTPLNPFGGYDDIVVLKLDGAGAYQWHTFYGAGTWDYADGITVDASGGVLVTGTSWDTWGTPVDPHGTNGWDIVVLKLDSAGAHQWHTFAGANSWNYGWAIAADDEGQVYVTGKATGTWGTPLHPFSGGQDIVVLALDAAGAYRWHTFYGAAGGNSEGRGVAVDDDGYVFVSGTSSVPWGTPLHAHAYSGITDFAVLKLDDAGTYQWHTFYGSTGGDAGRGITVDSSGQVVVTGTSWSTWGTPLHPISAYGWDLAVFALDSAGAYLWNTFYGSSASYGSAYGDAGFGIARDTTGNIYVAGASDANWGAPLHAHSGGTDIVVLKLLEWGFSFIDVVNAPLNTTQASNVISVAGIEAPASIAVSGDASSEYAVNGGAWTNAPGTVSDGDTVQVRHLSAATHLASVDTTLTIGAVSDTFTSTTAAADDTPDPFSFADVTGVPLASPQISNAITVTGITTAAALAVSGAASSEYAIGGGAWTSAPGTVTNGQTVRVRHTSAAAFGTAAHTTLSIGGASDTFTSTTEAEDTSPDPFSFTAQTGVAPDTLIVSNVVTVEGINSAASVHISGDGPVNEYSIGGGAWTSASGGVVSNGQTLQVRQRSAATSGTRRRLWLSVGGWVTAFDVTTGDDTVPDAFAFVDVTNVLLSTLQVSNTITVTGLGTPAPIAVSGDASSQYAIGAGAWTNAPGTVANGQTVRVRHTSSAANGSAVHTTLTIGGVSDTFTSVTFFDITPNPFTFEDVVDVMPATSQVSNTVLVTGINGPSPISVSGDASSQYAINGGAWTSAAGTVANGQTVRVRHTSGAGLNLAVHTRLVIGPVSDTFTSTTVPRMLMPVTGLEVWRSSGFGFTLRWRPPTAGVAPDRYVVTGGLLRWDGTRGPALGVLVTDVPIASFDHLGYPGVDLWVHVLAESRSHGSSLPTEVIVHRWSRPAPSTPTDLLALVNGSTLDLTWRNTFSGGLPSQLVLDVTGAITASIPLGLGESFRFSGVPPGTYVLRLRAVNASGSSPASAPVTVTLPDRCSGPPLPPTAFLAYRVGRRLFVVWQSAASGPAPTNYRVRVAGTYTGSLDTTARWADRPVSPGTYNLRVQAINECGVSEPTAVQSVVVP